MTASFVNKGTLDNNSPSATSMTPALPGSRVNSNVLIAVWAFRTSNQGASLDAGSIANGWVAGDSVVDTASASYLWAYRIIDGTETAPTATCALSGGVSTALAQIFQYSSNDQFNPKGATSHNAASSGTTETALAITTTKDFALAVAILIHFTTGAITTPAGWTKDSEDGVSAGSICMLEKAVTPAGSSSGNAAATITSSRWCGFQIEIKPKLLGYSKTFVIP